MHRILTHSKYLLFLLFLGLNTVVQAQEMLYPLMVNHQLKHYEAYLRQTPEASRAEGDTIDLPFFDDFSEPFTRLRTLADDYANPARWIGNSAYINNHFAINPISQGVATFDGLDEEGRAYGFGFELPSLSDMLTSNCIRLANPTDTVILSFYYQAQGLGNAPENDDLLTVEFRDTSGTWNRVWEEDGYTLEDFAFRRAMIQVEGEEYLYDGFQFRFVNYASLSGGVDHWHIDYVELDDSRSFADTLINDVSQLSQTSFLPEALVNRDATFSLLKEFSAMPWDHYKENPELFMGDTAYTAIRNNSDTIAFTNFSLQIYDYEGNLDENALVSTTQIFAGRICDNVALGSCNEGTTNNFFNNFGADITQFSTDTELSDDSTFFEVRYKLDYEDDLELNNLKVEKQEFYNYYAYDDGTAEAAYGLGELENVGRVAVKYNIKKPDDLTAIQIYLNPVQYDLSTEPVQLAVWAGNETPETELWRSETMFLQYTNHVNYFYHYTLDTVLNVSDNVWVGWIQQPATNLKFSIGFDKRTDNSHNVYYNLGTTWQQSSIPGSVMIRPSFGDQYTWVGVEDELTTNDLKVFPNPTNGTLHIQTTELSNLNHARIQVLDVSGRIVHQQTGYHTALQLQQLNGGVYIIRVDTDSGVFTERIVLQ